MGNALEIGTRWFWGGQHYTVLDITPARVLLVPDITPGRPRKQKWCDWIARELLETLMRDGRLKESGKASA